MYNNICNFDNVLKWQADIAVNCRRGLEGSLGKPELPVRDPFPLWVPYRAATTGLMFLLFDGGAVSVTLNPHQSSKRHNTASAVLGLEFVN